MFQLFKWEVWQKLYNTCHTELRLLDLFNTFSVTKCQDDHEW
jgi:hypothetical protein